MIPNDDKTLYADLGVSADWNTLARIVAWNDEGQPMIVTSRGLSSAKVFPNYEGVRFYEDLTVARLGGKFTGHRLQVPVKPKPEEIVWEEPKPFKSRFAKLAEGAVRNRERSDLDDLARMADEFEAKNSNP